MGVLGVFFNGLGSENYSGMKIPWAERPVQVRIQPGLQIKAAFESYNETDT